MWDLSSVYTAIFHCVGHVPVLSDNSLSWSRTLSALQNKTFDGVVFVGGRVTTVFPGLQRFPWRGTCRGTQRQRPSMVLNLIALQMKAFDGVVSAVDTKYGDYSIPGRCRSFTVFRGIF